MKTNNTWGAIRLCILGLFSLFTYGPSMGAKTGVITAPSGADENLRTLGATQPVRETLMGVIRQALQLAVAAKKAVITITSRNAFVFPAAQDLATVVAATEGYLGRLTRDDPTRATSPWSFEGEALQAAQEAAVEALTAAAKPSMSVEAVVNKIEDLGSIEGKGFVVVIDQTAGDIKLYSVPDDDAGAQIAATALVEDVRYVQTLDGGGAQFGE